MSCIYVKPGLGTKATLSIFWTRSRIPELGRGKKKQPRSLACVYAHKLRSWDVEKTASLTRLFLCLYSAFRVFFYSSMVNDLARASAFCVARRASASCAAHRVECSAFGSAFGPCKWPVLGELPRALPTSAKARPRTLTLPRV